MKNNQISHDPDGSIRSLRNGDLYTEYAYDADKNLSRLKTMLGTETLADNRYAYDGNGNRTEKRQPGGVTRYVYDALNRLTGAEYPDATEELFYDRAGNRTKRLYNGAEETYVYDPRNRLTRYTKGGVTTEFVYDRAGNLLKDDRAAYTYDAFNRVEKAETFDGHVQINRYDAEGLRHELEEDGRLVRFIFRGDEVVAEESMEDRIRYIRTDTLLASDAENARTYYHYASDEMGSVTHVIEGTEILNHYEYDAWGNLTACEEKVHNRFKFNGQQWDPITQQYYLRTRFYNPVIARFTQEDTYRGDGLNLYAYCRNNPVYYVDPSGHLSDCLKEAYLEARKNGMSKEDAYAYAKQVYEQNRAANSKPTVEVPDARGMTREQWRDAYRDARLESKPVNDLLRQIHDIEQKTGMRIPDVQMEVCIMVFENWSKYVYRNWETFSEIKNEGKCKHYFVQIPSEEISNKVEDLEKDLKIAFPRDLILFFKEVGAGYFWISAKDKIGIYNILSPSEIYDLYYPDEEEDWFATYRMSAWDNLENHLIAFCVFGEEDSLLYYAIDNGGIYYLSKGQKIADSLEEFLTLLDNEVDYFMKV
ncbi:MAG: SMI1/KNR4 family protein [Roseburia sp.]|nr:SMI1/KNR4 family protein [Roseburia sp.]